ncbi:MAG: hypothetical protein P4M09_15080 [Devosia sp.]|nr:hypothetical protein [Devosia sp.]
MTQIKCRADERDYLWQHWPTTCRRIAEWRDAADRWREPKRNRWE